MTRVTSTTKLLGPLDVRCPSCRAPIGAVCGARGVPLPCAERVELAQRGGR